MQKLIKNTLLIFIWITAATGVLAIIGIIVLWCSGKTDLPYLKTLLSSVVLEIIAVVIALATKGRKYLPDVIIAKEIDETIKFMKGFFKDASSIQIVSNRVSWIFSNEDIKTNLISKAKNGIKIDIFTPKELNGEQILQLNGINFYVTNEDNAPEARFTLINGNRGGCERLAIARGNYPDHEITVFDSYSGPQMISMAKDIIRKSKEQSNA